MELRVLQKEEHGRTRTLWETVFSEDSKSFLDYYYFIKTQDNRIYVLEENQEIRSMIQLNPYMLLIEDTTHLCHYVIGVATQKEYRSRGYMRRLLLKSMHDMYGQKEPFTFLMPAAEAIYTPYGFRFIYRQRQAELYGNSGMEEQIACRDARLSDAEALSDFFEQYARVTNESFEGTQDIPELMPSTRRRTFVEKRRYQVYAVRAPKYYQTLILEQQSENGGIRLVYCQQELVGMFAYAKEEGWEIREPVFRPEYEHTFFPAVLELTGSREVSVNCLAYSLGDLEKSVKKMIEKPVIMARILHLETLLKCIKVKAGERISCTFAVIDPLITGNNKIWKLQNTEGSDRLQVQETEDSQGVITIEALTELLFGSRELQEIAKEKEVILPESLIQELRKLEVLRYVYLNEIV